MLLAADFEFCCKNTGFMLFWIQWRDISVPGQQYNTRNDILTART